MCKGFRTSTSNSFTNWVKYGDIAHFTSLASSAIFAGCVISYANKPDVSFFDDLWLQDGFCLRNRDIAYWNSHDLSFYVDFVLAPVLGGLYLMLRNAPGMKDANDLVKYNIFGILAHGIGHEGAAYAMRTGAIGEDMMSTGLEVQLRNSTAIEVIGKTLIFGLVFYGPLLKATIPSFGYFSIMIMSVLAAFGSLMVPQNFGFTYTQTILMLGFSLFQLARPKQEKNFEYFLYPALVGVPLTIVGWLESTKCSSWIIHFGGHAIYDGYIPLSSSIFYIISYLRASKMELSDKKTA